MTQIQLWVFIAATVLIVFFSWWLSIKEKRYHGIFRFFAFESITLTVILDAYIWFKDPFSIIQDISWVILTLSLFVAIYAFYLIKALGKPKGKFENTSKLVITGIYKYIRHPMYLSLVLFCAGAYIKHIDLITTLLAGITLITLYLTAKVEEGEMIRKFRDQYRKYMKKTKMFIPGIF